MSGQLFTGAPRAGKPARQIPVAKFRQIHQWPLIHIGEGEPYLGPWKENEISDPLDLLEDGFYGEQSQMEMDDFSKRSQEAVSEFNYFHDFIQRFLYDVEPHRRAFKVFRRHDLTGIVVKINQEIDGQYREIAHRFKVERLTLHHFNTRAALVSFETVWETVEGNPNHQLTLADAQTLIDYTRRSYTPFWQGTKSARCPSEVTLIYGEDRVPHKIEQSPNQMFDRIKSRREDDAPIFPHWLEISGLRLNSLANDEKPEWRDPSDERIPVMSFIGLKNESNKPKNNRDVLNEVGDADWFRIADAEQSGTSMPYNHSFLKAATAEQFYDRFFCDDFQDSSIATRHLFGGPHYNLTTVICPEEEWDFGRDVLQMHFRRHYAQMSMMVRFEHASLLGFSSQITEAVQSLEGSDNLRGSKFEKKIDEIQKNFLLFVNRFRFTGISSQLQPAEMFDLWRKSLGLQSLFDDVSAELASTADYVRSSRDSLLNSIAQYFAAIALAIGVIATPVWARTMELLGFCTDQKCNWALIGAELLVSLGLIALFIVGVQCFVSKRKLKRRNQA